MEEYLVHHGIIGQKWGVRRYQNIDGSLTEEGYKHVGKFKQKATEYNNKYYDKHINKYQKQSDKYLKKASKTTDEDKRKSYESKSKEALSNKRRAEKTRKEVNKYYKNMGVEEVERLENETKARNLNNLKKVAIAGGIAATGGLGVAGAIGAKAAATAGMAALAKMDLNVPLNYAMKYADLGIRAYADVRGFATTTYIDEMLKNMEDRNAGEQVGRRLGALANQTSRGFKRTAGDSVNETLTNIGKGIGSGMLKATTSDSPEFNYKDAQRAFEMANYYKKKYEA